MSGTIKSGFTLIELLVTIFIIGLLVALTLPAIQSARESARRAHCTNNLRQIVQATSNFESQNGHLPPGIGQGNASPLLTILPFLELNPLYNCFNLSVEIFANPINLTASRSQVALYTCTSDYAGDSGRATRGGTNYAGNYGNVYGNGESNGLFDDVPILKSDRAIRLRDIQDGTSQTAAYAEWLKSGRDGKIDRARSFFVETASPTATTDDEFCDKCRSLNGMVGSISPSRGFYWYEGRWARSLYDHGIGINDPFCQRKLSAGLLPIRIASCPAGSNHPKGAHVAFADGHVSFIRQEISLPIWRALGSRNGGEAISDQSF